MDGARPERVAADYLRRSPAHKATQSARAWQPGNGSSYAALDSARRKFRHFRVIAAIAPPASLQLAGPARRGRIRAVHRQNTALRSLAMELTAIIVFTAIALWFVTEVGGENL
jgi:hypothetical protein